MSETELLIYSKDDKWKSSAESIFTQRVTKLTKSETLFPITSKFGSDVTFTELELREINVEDLKPKQNWELVRDRSRFPRIIQTRSVLRDELEILKINMSLHEKAIEFKDSQFWNYETESKRKKVKKLIKFWRKPVKLCHNFIPSKVKDLITEIEGSESAKTDTVIWKFLKRGSLRKEFLATRQFFMEIHAWHLSDSYIQNTQPTRVTCPNCRFFITTNVKRVSTIRTLLSSLVLALLGLCVVPHVLYNFKDTVHLCPLCKIYLGFCPALGIISRRRQWWLAERKHKSTAEEEVSVTDNIKMVSASSTSAKNLFVESKLRLSDRVQVNVNNIAAVARQIQRGSKSNENLIAAAKNYALQEAAIENSETNLKKLKLLTTHINSQLDSLQNSSSKMEMVLEQVRSMQR